MILLYSATFSAVPDSADAQSISRACTGNYDTTLLSNSQYSTRFSRRSVNIPTCTGHYDILYSATVSAVPDSADAQSISSTCTGNYDTTLLSNS